MPQVGVIVGRFQVPDLHDGHRALFDTARAECDELLVVLGVSAARANPRDPLPFEVRAEMVSHELRGFVGFHIVFLQDVGHAALWSQKLDALIVRHVPPQAKVVLYGSRDSFLDQYQGVHTVCFVEAVRSPSGSEVRKRIAQGGSVDALCSFSSRERARRKGHIRAVLDRPAQSYQAVDIAILRGRDLLLSQKERDAPLLRFVGGFVDPQDHSLEHAAVRELYEETGLRIAPEQLRYVGSFLVDDWRYRNLDDAIHTVLFVAYCCEQNGVQPQARDDIISCNWLALDALSEARMVPEHRPLFYALKQRV